LKRFRCTNSDADVKSFGGRFGPSFGSSRPILISAGVLGPTAGDIAIAAESGVTDDLDTITASADVQSGDTLALSADAGDTITVKHNTGNIHLDGSADKVLVNGNHFEVKYNGTDWEQLTPMMVLP
jgi:hypothetical protein